MCVCVVEGREHKTKRKRKGRSRKKNSQISHHAEQTNKTQKKTNKCQMAVGLVGNKLQHLTFTTFCEYITNKTKQTNKRKHTYNDINSNAYSCKTSAWGIDRLWKQNQQNRNIQEQQQQQNNNNIQKLKTSLTFIYTLTHHKEHMHTLYDL